MSTISQNNIRIAKNTIFLYIRMLLLLAVSLYTSRVILKTLGIDDYGIYNLVAGFVTLFSFINNALVSSMQRFFNTSLGERDYSQYQKVFSMSINIMILFSILILIVGETVGLWFVNNELNIPEGRYDAAKIVYQFSILTFIFNMMRTPYHASIVAHEDMSFFAYISIGEALLRLGIVFLLPLFSFDKLVFYGILYCLVIVIVNIPYVWYCKRKYTECKHTFRWEFSTFKELVSFSGWMLLGQSAVVVKNQGEAIFINRFFNVAANAAMGVASQVTAAVDMFVTNFQMAFNPQIVQTYAAKEYVAHNNLIIRASKFSFFLMLIITIPIITHLDFILKLWLVEIPLYTKCFIFFILISHLINAIGNPLTTSIMASGNIKYYQIGFSTIFILSIFLSFYVLFLGYPPYSISIVAIFVQIALFILRFKYFSKHSRISFLFYFKQVLLPISYISVISFTIPYILSLVEMSLIGSFFCMCVEVIILSMLIYFIGLTKSEKNIINQFLLKLIKR